MQRSRLSRFAIDRVRALRVRSPAASRPGSRRRRRVAMKGWLAVALLLTSRLAVAADKFADPTTYRSQLTTLASGDVLHLAAGNYHLLPLANLNGDATHPI